MEQSLVLVFRAYILFPLDAECDTYCTLHTKGVLNRNSPLPGKGSFSSREPVHILSRYSGERPRRPQESVWQADHAHLEPFLIVGRSVA